MSSRMRHPKKSSTKLSGNNELVFSMQDIVHALNTYTTTATRLRTPDIQLDVYLVAHGCEWAIYVDGNGVDGECKDFGNEYKIKDLQRELYKAIIDCLQQWTKGK